MILTTPGRQVPRGTVNVSGAKNAATRMLAAAVLSEEPIRLTNFPTELRDAAHKIRYLECCGVTVRVDREMDIVEVEGRQYSSSTLDSFDFPIRTTYLLAAGQLVRGQSAHIPYPGGCKLGERKYDLHVMVWEKFGCRVRLTPTHILVEPLSFKGCDIDFPLSTVGGTENALLCAVIAPGATRIRNAYITPEIENLIELLRRMGAVITVFGTSGLLVEGQSRLRAASCPVIPDRIEALTWLIFSAVSGGSLLISPVPLRQMEIPLAHLRSMGIDYLANTNSVFVSPQCLSENGIQPFEMATGTHPGVISDMQPFYVIAGLKAQGRSIVHDYRYPERTKYLEQLERFCPGAIRWSPGRIQIDGPVSLRGATAASTDLRGSMAVLLAALLAETPSRISGVEMALRGYNKLERKLTEAGIKLDLQDVREQEFTQAIEQPSGGGLIMPEVIAQEVR